MLEKEPGVTTVLFATSVLSLEAGKSITHYVYIYINMAQHLDCVFSKNISDRSTLGAVGFQPKHVSNSAEKTLKPLS